MAQSWDDMEREPSTGDNFDNNSDSAIIPEGMLPNYLAEAFGELYQEDGLCVLGKGLGCVSLLASFVRFYADTVQGHLALLSEEQGRAKSSIKEQRKPPLVLVLGLKESERNSLVEILQSWGTPAEMLPTMITNEAGQGKDRAALYQRGGVFCVTSRILIVDLLTNIASANDIDGLLVAHAEQVTEQSTEAFIIRIFQSQKQPYGSGFVKAFTDAPDQLVTGFAKVDKILKALHVRRLYLYPRFHHLVRDELEEHPPDVTELHQELSTLQQEIQNAIVAAVQACIRELKSTTTLLQWNDSELSVENCVTSNFDRAISRQLEQDWHRLKPQTKQLVQDLRTLRTLFQSLIQYDCVTFWKLINSIKTMSAASRYPSMWLLTPAADILFRKAKERVYKISKPIPSSKVPNPVSILKPVLEENPKWKLLWQVIDEIGEIESKRDRPENVDKGPINIIVMVQDERSLDSLRSYLAEGKDRTMNLKWFRFLEQYNDRSRSVADNKGCTSAISEESRLLLEEESRTRNFLFGTGSSKAKDLKRKKLNEVPEFTKRRRRIAAEKGRGSFMDQPDDLERRAVLDEAIEEIEHDMVDSQSSSKTNFGNGDPLFHVRHPEELRIILKSYSSLDGDQSLLLLLDLRPRYVVFYDSDISFIRAAEMFSSLSRDMERIKVFFLVFEASSEEKNFMKALEREQSAFEKLIHHKKTMPPPVLQTLETQEMQQARQGGSLRGCYMDGALPLAFDGRRGRGKMNSTKERRDIAVDVREFRSALPSILHQGGMRLAPVTLTIGDFVLSNVHCIERKSISDLFGSFASGRLYAQAEAMSRHYKCPCLLVEFDPSKSFCLQNIGELGVEIRQDSICSKITLLVMHFPNLRILWCRSPHETLRLFRELKANHDEVDVDKAVEIGRFESVESLLEDGSNDDDEIDEINEAGRDMLLRLPGVNVNTARKIMQQVDSLAELFKLSREELRRIAGPIIGQKLFTFFRQNIGAL